MDLCILAERILTISAPGIIAHGAVLVRGGRIAAVGRAADLHPPAGTPTLSLGDVTLLPGLIDAHAHLMLDGSPDPLRTLQAEDDSQVLLRMVHNATVLIRSGVTTVRDCACRNHLSLALRDAIRGGLLVGPNVLSAGRVLTITGGHLFFVGRECDGTDALRHAVRAEVKAGVDLIKVMGSGGRITPGGANLRRRPQLTADELALVVREAHGFGKRVAVHAHATAAIAQAVAAGADSVEHCLWLDDETGFRLDERTLERMAAQGTFVVPTLARFFPRGGAAESGDPLMRDIDPLLPLFARMREAGVRLVAGNDTGASYTPFTDLVHGLELMARFGMAPAELLRAATLTAAECLGRDDVGALAAGRRADLIAVRGNPLDDVRALWDVELIIKDGQVAWQQMPGPGPRAPLA